MKKDQNESLRAGSNAKRKQAKPAPVVTPAPEKAQGSDEPKRAKFRDGTKSAKIIALLSRPTGATITEMMKTTNWQPHSVRGFLSGAVRKKMGFELTSFKRKDGARAYRIAAVSGPR